MSVTDLTSLTDFKKITSGSSLCVIDYSASWCGPCQRIKPFFRELAKNESRAKFCEVDVDNAAEIAAHAKIKCMPTFKLYKTGKQVASMSGTDIKALEKLIFENL